ncbi:putative DNA modification/repair radical SAM protein [Mangrovibacterium diazotrophicum]|uniref:Putative DNA modification/repair radical SAM protein n=1 Tax=Mangrovibacterium diazotrophicum TaxID=1261403 RepID=A0A419W3R2_9BACT|nr:putative DNA modification/repair radical SAM protein [Mangrovibacterium diazotrophicum]RKD90107.1 putative DNA modification/repair radical SAM protein [Mangrovibacterium diazotrophicum]
MKENVLEKLKILADAAKYDVSCASSGNNRSNKGGIGNAVACGICHSFTDDGRCVSLLKMLMTNHCIYDCAYCINRRTNDRPRATMSVQEVVDLTINFYRRNYIEGLFLSSGIIKNADFTMERLMLVARKLRQEERYHGYIHLKAIPGSSPELIRQAGLFADRLSVNIEIPTEQQLQRLAPEKTFSSVIQPMEQIKTGIQLYKEDRRKYRFVDPFTPAGQSTQLIVGATPESDRQILALASGLYQHQSLKRVYYSGYLPVNDYDKRLPALQSPPLVRENRLYQSDWLMRFYHFQADEILSSDQPFLDLEIDPKLAYAIRNLHLFPVDINRADYEMILRVPGIGVQSAKMIVDARRFRRLNSYHLKQIGVVMKRAQYFITCNELPARRGDWDPDVLRSHIIHESTTKRCKAGDTQLSLFHFQPPKKQPELTVHFKQ